MAKRSTTTTADGGKVSRDDLERKFRTFQDGIKGRVDEKRNTIATVAGVGAVVVVILVFVLGRRSGKRKTTVVEIRRV